jgi:hypothetical protein
MSRLAKAEVHVRARLARRDPRSNRDTISDLTAIAEGLRAADRPELALPIHMLAEMSATVRSTWRDEVAALAARLRDESEERRALALVVELINREG